jgi:hypothetical protein
MISMPHACRIVVLLALLPLCMGADGPAADRDGPVVQSEPKPKPVVTPEPERLERGIRRGVDFLLKRQNRNGSWGSASSTRPEEIYLPVPGGHLAFRAAVTSLCISALIETGGDRAEVATSIDRGEAWLMENLPAVRRPSADTIYNNWAHAYSIDALAHMLRRHAGNKDRCRKIRELMGQQIERLGRYECVDGGWCYYDFAAHTQTPSGSTISFVTATVMVAFSEARDAGLDVPQRLIDRAKASMLRQRNSDFAYDYGEYLKYRPRLPINRPAWGVRRRAIWRCGCGATRK